MITRRVQRWLRALPEPMSGSLVRRGLVIDPARAEGVRFKVAETRDALEAAYQLVHDVYVAEGYSDPHESGLRVNLRYALPTTATIIGTDGPRVAITLTVMGDSPLGLPMDMIFSRELYELRRQGRYIVEIGALASHPSFRKRQQAVALYADKASLLYAIHHLGADDVVIAINPKHVWVYQHLLLFEVISGVKRYHYVNDAPAVAMRLDLQRCLERWRRAYTDRPPARNFHTFFTTDDSQHITLPPGDALHNVWDEGLFSYFFEHRTDPRREGHGTLLDLYRMLYTLPETRPENRAPAVPFTGSLVASG